MQKSTSEYSQKAIDSAGRCLSVFKTDKRRNLVQMMDSDYTTPPFKGGGEKWVTMPDQVGIMLMWLRPDLLEMIVRKAVQRGLTEIALGAHMLLIERGESSVYVMPNSEMAGALDKSVKHWQRTVPFVSDRMLSDPEKMRETRNKIKEKQYTTCTQYFFGAGGAGSTSQYTVSFATADEAEKIDDDPANQGSVWAGFDGRFQGLLTPGRKRLFSSPQSPDGIVSQLLNDCDHVMRCEMPCPLCGEFSVLRWGQKSDNWGIKFDEHGTSEERAESVRHICQHCENPWTEDRYQDVIGDCRWMSESGYLFDVHEGDDGEFKLKLGSDFEVVPDPYKIGLEHTDDGAGLYGRSDWKAAVRRCIDYEAAAKKTGNTFHKKRFTNEFRAMPFKEEAEREIPTSELLDRREVYDHWIPDDVQYLVMGVDFGGDYSKYQIDGFGYHDRYGIEIVRTDGDAKNHESRMFTAIDTALKREYKNQYGKTIPLVIAIMDGRFAQSGVQALAAMDRDPKRRIVVYGDGKHPRKPMFDHDRKKDWNKEAMCFEVTINPHKASDALYYKASIPKGEPGYYHIPKTEDFDRLWANEFTSDKKKKRKVNNQWIDVYEKDHSGIKGESHDTGKYVGIGDEVALDFNYVTPVEDWNPGDVPKELIIPQPQRRPGTGYKAF